MFAIDFERPAKWFILKVPSSFDASICFKKVYFLEDSDSVSNKWYFWISLSITFYFIATLTTLILASKRPVTGL
jgi:hypothetical protein